MTTAPHVTDLTWKPHPARLGGEQAIISFPNGYGASVLRGSDLYYTNGGTYEIAVLHGEDITFDTPITDDVLGYQDEDEANAALLAIAALPAKD